VDKDEGCQNEKIRMTFYMPFFLKIGIFLA